ncbi:hypothetical protein AX17_006705 [Amanita inopinata Kibby_2008]|nr:hypothetical protein AX17_006705 [Amanita inopinata Kibby_2008]
MDFEELALKSIDPSLGPRILSPNHRPTTVARSAGSGSSGSKNDKTGGTSLSFPSSLTKEGRGESIGMTIPLIYPPSISTGPKTLSELRALVSYRMPKHRKGFYLWMIVAPLTAPFIIVPVIPNIPFFFCVWRSWSHYRAYKASQYLDTLLENGIIVPEESQSLDSVYASSPASLPSLKPESETDDTGAQSRRTKDKEAQHTILLTREAVPAIIRLFSLKSSAEADLYRAVEQARLRVESARTEL